MTALALMMFSSKCSCHNFVKLEEATISAFIFFSPSTHLFFVCIFS